MTSSHTSFMTRTLAQLPESVALFGTPMYPLKIFKYGTWFECRFTVNSIPVSPLPRSFASPLSEEWPTGWCDMAIFTQDATTGPLQPPLGLDSEQLYLTQPNNTQQQAGFFVQIHTIFHPIWDLQTSLPLYLTYVQRFDVVPQAHLPRGQRLAPDMVQGMYTLC